MSQAGWVAKQPTYGLRNMIRALSIMELMNTDEENQRLALAKAEITRRCASSYSGTRAAALGCNLGYIRNVNKFPLQT